MHGKVAIITGGAQGIGKGIALRFLQEGVRVVIADLDEQAGRMTEEAFSKLGAVRFVHTDVGSEDGVRRCVEATVREFGGIGYLINNAGIGVSKPVVQLSLDEWNRVLATNLTGIFLFARHASPHLKAARGAIVNIASTRALMSEPNTEAYSASKGGVVSLTHSLAISLGPEIRVNCISPGWIDVAQWQKAPRESDVREVDRKFHPAGRVGRCEDIAAMTLFLCGDQSGFITGQNFVIDGGVTRKMIYP